MNSVLYILMCLPAVIMIILGIALSKAKKDSVIKKHHFAGNFNIRKYTKKVILLFSFTGILFSTGGILLISGKTGAGIACMLISFVVFLISFIAIQKKY